MMARWGLQRFRLGSVRSKTLAATDFKGRLLMRDAPITVCFPFIGDGLGGSHISAVKLIAHLDPDLLVTPVVALHVGDGPLAAYLADKGVPFVNAPGGAFQRSGNGRFVEHDRRCRPNGGADQPILEA